LILHNVLKVRKRGNLLKSIFIGKGGYIRAGWGIALAVFTYMLMAFLSSMLTALFFDMNVIIGNPSYDNIQSFFTSILVAAAMVALFCLLYKKKPAEMGLDKKKIFLRFIIGVGVGIVAVSLVSLSFFLYGNPTFTWVGFTPENTFPIITSMLAMIGVALHEEVIYRGFFMSALRTTGSKIAVFAIPPFIFSAMHLFNPDYNIRSFITAAMAGFLFAYMFVRTGSLYLPMGFHFAWNFSLGGIWGLPLDGEPEPALIHSVLEAPPLLADSEIASMVVLILVFLFVRFVIPKEQEPSFTLDKMTKEVIDI
jgi:membrane protease YdiL (CAAX protease family)